MESVVAPNAVAQLLARTSSELEADSNVIEGDERN